MIVDMKCPRCNAPVYGREEVRVMKRPSKKTCTCQRCGCQVELAPDEEIGGVECLFYRAVPTNQLRR